MTDLLMARAGRQVVGLNRTVLLGGFKARGRAVWFKFLWHSQFSARSNSFWSRPTAKLVAGCRPRLEWSLKNGTNLNLNGKWQRKDFQFNFNGLRKQVGTLMTRGIQPERSCVLTTI